MLEDRTEMVLVQHGLEQNSVNLPAFWNPQSPLGVRIMWFWKALFVCFVHPIPHPGKLFLNYLGGIDFWQGVFLLQAWGSWGSGLLDELALLLPDY